MKISLVGKVVLPVLLITVLSTALGCDAVRGGAKVYLEGISIGELSLEGKPIQGLPVGKINAELKVSASEVYVKPISDGAVITLSPSGATITIKPDGLSISGVEADQVELKLQEAE